MTTTRKFIAATAIIGAIAVHHAGAATAGENPHVLTMKPLQGVSFDLGTKRAISYYLADDGTCDLVLSLVEPPEWDDLPALTTTRFEVAILAGKTRRFTSAEGKTLEFACQAGAEIMSVTPVEKIAAE